MMSKVILGRYLYVNMKMQIATGTEQKAKMLKNAKNWRTFFVAVVLILNQIKRHMNMYSLYSFSYTY